MQEIQEDYYQILGVEDVATPDEIRKAYLKLAKKLHPDRFPNDPEKRAEAQLEFSKVTRAHEVLGDPRQKDEYDALRLLAKNRAALDAGGPGTVSAATGGGSAPSVSQTVPAAGVESKESWAAKHCLRAKECYSKKRYVEAETAIKEAIRLLPNKSEYHCCLAEIYLARGWKTLAKSEIEMALRLDPKDADAKQIELKMKANDKGGKGGDEKKGGGLLDQIKQLLNKKM